MVLLKWAVRIVVVLVVLLIRSHFSSDNLLLVINWTRGNYLQSLYPLL